MPTPEPETPEELRERIAEETTAPEETPPPASPPSPTPPPTSSHESEPHDSSARELSRHLRLMQDTINLLTERHDQAHKLLTQKAGELDALMAEMKTTMDLCQQMIGRQDEQVENLGLGIGALMRMEQRFTQHLAEIRENNRE